MMTTSEIISDEEIDLVHANANFGDQSKRNVVDQALLKCACGYHNGHTAQQIVREHGLLLFNKSRGVKSLSKKGRQYLWAAFGENSP